MVKENIIHISMDDVSILLQSLYNTGVNGKSLELIRACYRNLVAMVKAGSTLSLPFPVTRSVQRDSVLLPAFFQILIVLDKLLKESSSKTSVCGLYLGGAAYADDVWVAAPSAPVTEQQGLNLPLMMAYISTVRKQDIKIQEPWNQAIVYPKLCVLPMYGQTICLQDREWRETSTRLEDIALLLAPW